jgi:RecA/RadA recombinase
MNTISRLFNLIKRGLLGLNKGLPMGLPKLEKIVDGIQRSTYTVLAGGTGSGKTTLALYSYVYRPLVDNMALGADKKRIKILYFSLEMSAEILLAKLLSLHIYETYGIELSFKEIISKQDVLSDDNYKLIEQCADWLDAICQDLIIYDKPLDAASFYAIVMNFATENGTWSETERTKTYTANDPDELVEIVIDHMGLLRRSGNRTKKEEIDLTSNYIMTFRNKCSYSALALLQLNRTSSSMDRRNAEMQEIQLDDIKDTGGPSEDAELVVAIFNPWREKMARYKNYNIRVLQDKFRAIQVLKNRLGEADKSVAVNFFGSIGLWRELPKADVMLNFSDREYEPYLGLVPESSSNKELPSASSNSGFVYTF